MASTSVTTVTSSPATPKTPVSKISPPVPAVQTPSPGHWQHPRLVEITRRRKTSTFDSSDVRKIVLNFSALVVSFVLPSILRSHSPSISALFASLFSPLGAYEILVLYLLRILLLSNICFALYPLWREPDQLTDIPLTPSQRALLGLNPAAKGSNQSQPTPQTAFVTPPRYQRSTPRSQSPASRPGSGVGAGAGSAPRRGSGAFEGSPSWTRTIRDSGARRSSSGNRGSPLNDLIASTALVPATPSPSSGRGTGASVGLNSRWLYERGRSSSGSRGFGL